MFKNSKYACLCPFSLQRETVVELQNPLCGLYPLARGSGI